jgi:hypothetical protein
MTAPLHFPVRRLWHSFATNGINPALCVVSGSCSPNRESFMRCAPSNSATDHYFLSVFRRSFDGSPIRHSATSGLPRGTDIVGSALLVRFVPPPDSCTAQSPRYSITSSAAAAPFLHLARRT